MTLLALTLWRLFLPHSSNNHQAKLRQHSGLLGLIGLVILLQVWVQVVMIIKPEVLGYSSSITTESILQLTNQKRTEHGLSALRLDPQLVEAAGQKASDMFARDYWAHVTPTGGQPWSFITTTGYTYLYAGENLARDFGDPQAVIDAWMASPTHKDNLLNSNYNDIGIVVSNGNLSGVQTTLVVQMFGTRRSVNKEPEVASGSTTVKEVAVLLSPTLVPTVMPTAVPTLVVVSEVEEETPFKAETVAIEGGETVALSRPVEDSVENLDSQKNIGFWFSPFELSKAVGLAIAMLLAVVLLADEVVMRRKHLGRIAGRSWAHFVFLLMTLGILFWSNSGVIL